MKKSLISSLLTVVLLVGVLSFTFAFTACGDGNPFSGSAAVYYDSLLSLGFPRDYAIPLTELHLLHPEWEFHPLNVTQVHSSLTWNYVVGKETASPSINVINGGNAYTAYRHADNTQTEPGYYRASENAVCYFLDPRNFLNETDIFQFCDLSSTGHIGENGLAAVLRGTFLETGTLENGKTYAEYLTQIGKEVGIDPVYVAVRVRQEIGATGSTPVISGTCGSLLWSYYKNQQQQNESGTKILPPETGYTEADLKAYDGLYNFYNFGATGSGLFSIYLGAMKRAANGTPNKAEDWGGSPAWDTRWKALWGGAYSLANNYIAVGQYSLYLQKFDVNRPNGKIAEHQYMANVAAALTEARSLFRSYSESGALNTGCVFRIPVYEGMPKKVSPDPANGKCAALAPATALYAYRSALELPVSANAEENRPLSLEQTCYNGDVLSVKGDWEHSYGTMGLDYRWDSGNWLRFSTEKAFELSVDVNFSDYGEHILLIRGEANYDPSVATQKSNRYVLILILNIRIADPPPVGVTFQDGEQTNVLTIPIGSSITLPERDSEGFLGWTVNGQLLRAGSTLPVQEPITLTAVCVRDFRFLSGAALALNEEPTLRFYAALSKEDTDALSILSPGVVRIGGKLYREGEKSVTGFSVSSNIVTATDGTVWKTVVIDTPSLTGDLLDVLYHADFYLTVTFADGSQKTVWATGTMPNRSARQVAKYALADPASGLDEHERNRLQTLFPN